MSTLVKLGGTAASLGGVALSNKVLAATWKKITGNEPPATLARHHHLVTGYRSCRHHHQGRHLTCAGKP